MADSNTTIKLIDLDNLSTYHSLMDAKKEEHSIILTQAQYNALTPEEKMNGKTYYISDAGSSGMIITASDVLMTGYSKASSASAITTNDTGSIAFGKLEKGLEDTNSDVDNIEALIPSSATTSNKLATANDIPDVSGFITKAVDDLTNYYLKTETYTKTEVDTIATNIKNSRFEVVSTLPTTNIKTNVIYLVPKSTAQTNNAKDEYINLDGTTSGWEKIGDTDIDLSGYVTTQALNTALADYTTTTDLNTLLSGYIAKSNTSGLVKNDGTIDTNSYALASALPGVATTQNVGLVKPDNTTINVDSSGVLSAVNNGTVTQVKVGTTEYNPTSGVVSLPAYPTNTDRYVNSASFADDSTNNNVKMTLTRAGSDTATVTANIPKVSSSSAGVAPKGAAVSSQSQSTKFLREDGTWAAPSYTTNTNTTYTFANGTNGFTVTPSNGSAQTVTVTPNISNATTASAGLMSSTDKTKLNGISTEANKKHKKLYTLNANSWQASQSEYGVYTYRLNISDPYFDINEPVNIYFADGRNSYEDPYFEDSKFNVYKNIYNGYYGGSVEEYPTQLVLSYYDAMNMTAPSTSINIYVEGIVKEWGV